MKLWELLANRVETKEGPFSREKFRASLAKIAAEFEAAQPKRRRRRRGRHQVEQSEPINQLDDCSSSSFAELNR
jgi:hypothetical protein